MKAGEVKTIAVLGAGDMGHGIAEVALLGGYRVALRDVKQEFVDRGMSRIADSLAKLAERGRITEENRKEMMGRIKPFVDIKEAVRDADFIIEAVPENMSIKQAVFKELDRFAPKQAVFASNTSFMSITEIGGATGRPDKVVGMHFFNPVVLMKLVEIIRGNKSSDEAMQTAYEVGAKMGKVPIKVEKDSIGFVYNRVNSPPQLYYTEILARGWAKPEEIDAAVMAKGAPMGPYELLDYMGLDVTYDARLYLAQRLSPEYYPPEWLQKMIKAGELGRKTGKGIYDWSKGRPRIDLARAKKDFDEADVIALQLNEATKLLEEGVVSRPDEIDKAVVNVGGATKGPFQSAREIGVDKLARRCEELAGKFRLESFKPTTTLKKGKI